MSEYLKNLNPEQYDAVTTISGPVMVIAGPGSGKTRVLTYRIAYLIEQGVPPHQILALTFTNKAAREMKARIASVVGEKAHRVWAGTFHSVFAKILRIEAEKIGYTSNFTIYDTDDAKSVLKSIIKQMNLNETNYNVNAIYSRISSAKSQIIPPRAYLQDEELLAQDNAANRPYVGKIYAEYMKRCKRADAMDFDDLLYQLFRLFHQNPDNVIEKYRSRFKYVLVDEFQDTNFLQYAIIKKLVNYPNSPKNVCIVGDDAQSIYAFRGATIENILTFEKDYPNLKTFKLIKNYRSTDHIVHAANDIISYNPKQIKKTIESQKGVGQKIQVIKAMTDNEEGKRVAGLILEQKNRFHLKNEGIAILYRTNAQSRVFEEHLRRYDIPYRVFGGTSFYQRKEVKDLLAYLRLIINTADDEALKRIINYPRRGIGKTTFDKIISFAATNDLTIWESLSQAPLSAAASKNIRNFLEMFSLFSKKLEKSNAYEMASFVARQSGIIDFMKRDTTPEGLGRLENIHSLLDGIQEFSEDDVLEDGEAVTDKSLAAYLQNVALITDFDQNEDSTDYVNLMSVHAAKGLEFKSVFVVGLEENLFPSFMALKDTSKKAIEEERRLFYVAVTRAEAHLTLSFAKSRYTFGQVRENETSRFLEEIGSAHLDGLVENLKKSTATPRASVSGNFSVSNRQRNIEVPADFTPTPSKDIQAGHQVRHARFGKGKVLTIDGGGDSRVATIHFQAVGQKRIMLRFAKLQVVG